MHTIFFLQYALVPVSLPVLRHETEHTMIYRRYLLLFGLRVAFWTVAPWA
jgi:hypothetical protein